MTWENALDWNITKIYINKFYQNVQKYYWAKKCLFRKLDVLNVDMLFYNILLIGFSWHGKMKSRFDKNEWCELS